MHRIAMALALLSLGSCGPADPHQSMEECKFEMRKAMPSVDPNSSIVYLNPGAVPFMQSCMASKRFEYQSGKTGCGSTTGLFSEACYKRP